MAEVRAETRVISRDSIGQFISTLEAAKHRTAERSAEVGEAIAKAQVPRRTERTAATIQGRVVGNQAVVTVGGAYAFHVKGTKPHTIRARRHPNLRFWWEREGVLFRGPVVNHPGNRPYPYMQMAYKAMTATVMQIAREEYR